MTLDDISAAAHYRCHSVPSIPEAETFWFALVKKYATCALFLRDHYKEHLIDERLYFEGTAINQAQLKSYIKYTHDFDVVDVSRLVEGAIRESTIPIKGRPADEG